MLMPGKGKQGHEHRVEGVDTAPFRLLARSLRIDAVVTLASRIAALPPRTGVNAGRINAIISRLL